MKVLRVLKYVLISCLITLPTQVASKTFKKESPPEALAFCWKNNAKLWWCDGPNQILWNGKSSLKLALVKVGCPKHIKFRPWAGNKRLGFLFYCGSSLKSYDRNIRKRYGLK